MEEATGSNVESKMVNCVKTSKLNSFTLQLKFFSE